MVIKHHTIDHDNVIYSFSLLPICLTQVGLGMYKYNAIQFGLDQMLSAPSKLLSSFIHWYFWCSRFLTKFYVIVGTYFIVNDYGIHATSTNDNGPIYGAILLAEIIFQMFC